MPFSSVKRTIVGRLRPGLFHLMTTAALGLGLASAFTSTSRAQDAPATTDALLKLVPADVGLVLTIDRLRDQSRAILSSLISQDLQRLPAFKAWLDSRKVRDFLASREQIEDFLRVSFKEIGDEIFGDSVLLALRLPADQPVDPANARGLLVLQARDPKLLKRLLDLINSAQKINGELTAISEHKRAGAVYFTREYPANAGRLAESFVTFPDGTFAFSNDEDLIHQVIDRKAGVTKESTADLAGFQTVAAKLPRQALARAFLNPGFVRRIVENLPPGDTPDTRKALDMIQRYVEALEYAGAALIVRESEIKLQAVQSFQAEKLRQLAGSWVSPPSPEQTGPGPRLRSIPASTLAMASLSLDGSSLYRFLIGLVPVTEQPKIEKLEAVADGLLLGLDLRNRILPALGPRVVAYLEAPDLSPSKPPADELSRVFPFPVVVAVEINEEGDRGGPALSTASALDNALRTLLTALSLDEKRVPASSRVEVRDGVTALSTPYPFAYAVDRPGRRLALGTSALAVARYLEADVDPNAGARFRTIQEKAFPGCESFVCLDLAAVHELATRNKDRLIASTAKRQQRPAGDVAQDLDQVLGLVQLFDAAFLSGQVDTSNAVIEHTLGLLPRTAETRPAVGATP